MVAYRLGTLKSFSLFILQQCESPSFEEIKDHIEPYQNGSANSISVDEALHSDLQKLSTYAKKAVDHKDLMTVKPLNGSKDVLVRGDCSSVSVVDKHQSKSMFGIEEWKFNGIGSYYEFSFEPKKTNCAMKLL